MTVVARQVRRTLVATCAVGALAGTFAVAGCGGDEDAADTGRGAGAGSGSAVADAAVGDDRQQIRRAFEQLRQAVLIDPDPRQACSLMSKAAKREFAQNGGAGCEAGLAAYLDTGETAEDPNPRLMRIEVDGERATVIARAKTSKGPQRAALVKEGDKWKFEHWLTD